MLRKNRLFIPCLILTGILSSCQPSANNQDNAEGQEQAAIERPSADSLMWSYQNGPVAPDYQRRWEVVLKGDSAFGRLMHLDQTLWSNAIQVNKDSLKYFFFNLEQCHIESDSIRKDQPCVGYGSHQISFFMRGRALNGEAYFCGDMPGGSIKGESRKAGRLFLNLIPGMMKVVDTSFGGSTGVLAN